MSEEALVKQFETIAEQNTKKFSDELYAKLEAQNSEVENLRAESKMQAQQVEQKLSELNDNMSRYVSKKEKKISSIEDCEAVAYKFMMEIGDTLTNEYMSQEEKNKTIAKFACEHDKLKEAHNFIDNEFLYEQETLLPNDKHIVQAQKEQRAIKLEDRYLNMVTLNPLQASLGKIIDLGLKKDIMEQDDELTRMITYGSLGEYVKSFGTEIHAPINFSSIINKGMPEQLAKDGFLQNADIDKYFLDTTGTQTLKLSVQYFGGGVKYSKNDFFSGTPEFVTRLYNLISTRKQATMMAMSRSLIACGNGDGLFDTFNVDNKSFYNFMPFVRERNTDGSLSATYKMVNGFKITKNDLDSYNGIEKYMKIAENAKKRARPVISNGGVSSVDFALMEQVADYIDQNSGGAESYIAMNNDTFRKYKEYVRSQANGSYPAIEQLSTSGNRVQYFIAGTNCRIIRSRHMPFATSGAPIYHAFTKAGLINAYLTGTHIFNRLQVNTAEIQLVGGFNGATSVVNDPLQSITCEYTAS